jgi:hypothetical protein
VHGEADLLGMFAQISMVMEVALATRRPRSRSVATSTASTTPSGTIRRSTSSAPFSSRGGPRKIENALHSSGASAGEGRRKQVDIAVPAFGYKNHAAIDRHHGFFRGWSVTDAAAYDGAQLKSVLRHNTGSKIRSAIEHIFARQKGPMRLFGGFAVRSPAPISPRT